ncbi:LPS export ABC transporter periplasmic protein LptC [Viscerimonas tarda]
MKNKGIYIVACFIGMLFVCCGGEKKEYVDIPLDNEKTPTMSVDSVTELISDSGIIRYKLITRKWLFFDKAKDPHWFFPEGLYVEQFDTAHQVQVTLRSDTAWNYKQRKLWKLKGNVFFRNSLNETFESQELYWDERRGKVYSDMYIEINRPDKLMLKGFGFVSNQQMTEYQILRPHDSYTYVQDGGEIIDTTAVAN